MGIDDRFLQGLRLRARRGPKITRKVLSATAVQFKLSDFLAFQGLGFRVLGLLGFRL